MMYSTKAKSARCISVWVLIFALIFTMLSASFTISARAAGVMDDVGRAAREVTSDVGDAVSDVLDPNEGASNGTVGDTDGVIGNEQNEDGAEPDMDEGRSIGWIGLVIAIVIVLIAIVLIVILMPKKKKR